MLQRQHMLSAGVNCRCAERCDMQINGLFGVGSMPHGHAGLQLCFNTAISIVVIFTNVIHEGIEWCDLVFVFFLVVAQVKVHQFATSHLLEFLLSFVLLCNFLLMFSLLLLFLSLRFLLSSVVLLEHRGCETRQGVGVLCLGLLLTVFVMARPESRLEKVIVEFILVVAFWHDIIGAW